MLIEFRKLIVPAVAVFLFVLLGQANAETLAIRVASSTDDAEENIGSGGMESLTSSDLELGSEFNSGTPDAEGIQLAGIRFAGVDIPAGAMINSASIQFTVDEEDKVDGVANFGIFGELSADAATFTGDDSNISGRDATTNVVAWLDVPTWNGQVGTAGPDQLTPDLASILQELVNQSDWAAGNAMAFGIAPIDPATGDFDIASQGNRTAESFDGGGATGAPLLQVDFSPVPEPSSMVLVALGLVATAGFRRRR